MLLAEEPFLGFQGEGITQGKHSLFIRLPLCNLQCSFCDSKYSWGKGKEYSLELIRDLVSKTSNIVITGGEPFLSNNFEIVKLLMNTFSNKSFEIETNGTLLPSLEDQKEYLSRSNLLINVSPKGNFEQQTPLSTEPVLLSAHPITTGINRIVKFLFDSKEDLDYIEEVRNKYSIDNRDIYVQPKGTTSDKIKEIIREFYDEIIEKGYNLSIRSHVMIFENKRGV